jgi:multiple sugar transport system permease protein
MAASLRLALPRPPRWRLALRYLACVALLLVFVAPLLSALTVAVTPQSDLFASGRTVLWPHHITLDNVRKVWNQVPFLHWYLNSLRVAVLFTLGQVISTSLTAYALARFTFLGRRVLLFAVLATMMIPFQSLMIPLLQLVKHLGWVNTQLPLWVPGFFGDITGAFGILLMRQAFLQVPEDFADAAMLDGANPFQVFWRIYMPLVRPQVAVVAVFSFMNSWNDFIRPIVYITDKTKMTVTGGLSFFQTAFHVEWGPLMAGSLLSLLPTLVLYAFAQRYFVQSVIGAGVKG